MATPDVDDEFHPPTSDDPYWTETCWFTFAVPERRLSAQLYPFFHPNQGVCAAGAFAWDTTGDQPWNARYAKNLWHLPLPDQPLSDLELPNGIRYRCVEPLTTYEIAYEDPDDGAFAVDLTFTGVQLGRTLTAEGETLNRFGLHLNPNLFTWNCLTHWTWDGGEGYGEAHDNWAAAGARRYFVDPAHRDHEEAT